MKQNITIKQLQELVGKQDEVLHKWCVKKGYSSKGKSISLLSIGQMLEFLGERKGGFYRIQFSESKLLNEVLWFNYKFKEFDEKYENKQLCNSLWQAVKEKLNG